MKKTRAAVGATVQQVNAQRVVLAQVAGVVNVHSRILAAGFFGRLRWLIAGTVPDPKVVPAKVEAAE